MKLMWQRMVTSQLFSLLKLYWQDAYRQPASKETIIVKIYLFLNAPTSTKAEVGQQSYTK